MRISRMNSTCTIIKKSISLLIAGASVIALIFLSSFAAPSVNSPLPEPSATVLDNASGHIVTVPVVLYSSNGFYNTSSTCILQIHTFTFPVGSNPIIKYTGYRFYASDRYTYHMDAYDVLTGNIVWQRNETVYQNNPVRVPNCPFEVYSIPQAQGLFSDQYMLAGEVATYYNFTPVEPFVNWSLQPSDHNTYHSELSEPVADEYNSYFICNDRLYWLSYRANGLYSFNQNFELSSQVYQEDVSYSSSGQGTYAGQANGYTSEPVSISDGSFAGVGTGGTPVVGVYSGFNLGQISYVGVNTGNLRLNSNGQMTYNDLEVYPVSVNSQFLNRLFDIVVYLTDDSGFKIWLVPRSDLGQNLVLDASLYCSCFDLTNGDYISSSFSSYTGNYQYAGFDYPLDDKIESVRCYGCAFYNVNNVPVHLSDVLWQYDLEFVEWRDRMEVLLNQIYKALAGEDVETMTYTQPSWDDDLNDAEPATYISNDEMLSVFDSGLDSVRPSPDATSSITSWVNMFSIPKLIAVACFALAMGTIILTLGKKKSD